MDNCQGEGTQVTSASENIPTVKCRKHSEEAISHVCKECRITVCCVCIEKGHVGHNCATVDGSTRMLNNMLKIEASNVECLLENVEDVSDKLTKTRDNTLKTHTENIDAIKQKRDEIIAEITRKTDELIAKIDETAVTDTESFGASIRETNSLLTSGQNTIDNMNSSGKDPVVLLQKLEQIWNYSDDYKRSCKSAGEIKETSQKYTVNVEIKADEFEFTLSPDSAGAHSKHADNLHKQLVPSNISAANNSNGFRKTKMLMPGAFQFDVVKEISSRVENGYIYIISTGGTHETYRIIPYDTHSARCKSVCVETEASLSEYDIMLPIICGGSFIIAYFSHPAGRSYARAFDIWFYTTSDLSNRSKGSLQLQGNKDPKAFAHVDENTCLLLCSDYNGAIIQKINIKEKSLGDKHTFKISDHSNWSITGPLLVTKAKELIFFATKGNSQKRALQYDFGGKSGKTIEMPDEILRFSDSAVIDDKDQIWISTDSGHIKRFSLDGSQTLDLDLGSRIHHMMTDGVAIYVHYMDKHNQRKFEKIEVD